VFAEAKEIGLHIPILEYPGGVIDISPGLSVATPREKCTPSITTLEGWQIFDPFGVAILF
jgi:hypothetical protein